MKGKWFKVKFSTKKGLQFLTENALVLAEDELQVMNFIRDYCGEQFVESEVQPYCAVPVMTADFLTLNAGKPNNIDYIMVAVQ